MENQSLKLLVPPPEERLSSWLEELYGKPVTINKRELLRHRDLSFVERLYFSDAVPETLIYKVVLPPWDIEQELHERVLIPSISNSARLYLSGRHQGMTALFFEDFGHRALVDQADQEMATTLGVEIARLHRSFTYRIDEIGDSGILKSVLPADYEAFCQTLCSSLKAWQLLNEHQSDCLLNLGRTISLRLRDEPISLVHGDLYAENVLVRKKELFIIDWSWFTHIGSAILDLTTLTMDHFKNGALKPYSQDLLAAYCSEYSRDLRETKRRLPFAEALSRLFFLHWLVERKSRGITGTTIGPVEPVMLQVVEDLIERLNQL
ncbi:MAG: phosphotransferase [Candidatus Obscuribacterales bacterium]|nr:phosphotransferase [Candidatus Obscuribacterales bacterium]